MTKLYCYLASMFKSEEGATMVEYGLIVALIAVVVAVGAEILGGAVSDLFEGIAGQL